MTPIEIVEKKLGLVALRLEEAKNLRILSENVEWKSLSRKLEQQLIGKINALCAQSCTDRDAIALRAEISTLRWFARAPKIKDDDFKRMADEFEDLRRKVDLLHTRGHNSADPAESAALAENAERLARELEAMP